MTTYSQPITGNSPTAEQLDLYDPKFFPTLDDQPTIIPATEIKKVGIQNRRYLGNKQKLLGFINEIIENEIGSFSSLCDIFAGTGVVGNFFNKSNIKIISNDFLSSNYIALNTWLGSKNVNIAKITSLIEQLNSLEPKGENYASINFGNIFFSVENARKIGAIRELINHLRITEQEKHILLSSLIYAVDKVANTCGHYDAYRKNLDCFNEIELRIPDFNQENNHLNEIYQDDANILIRKIECDVLYLDPPYNSRQYSDTYHLLENIALWNEPPVFGKAKKMTRDHLKSRYCLKSAAEAFKDLIENAACNHILVSYNNTADKKDGRSNARISDDQIMIILNAKGETKVFERDYRAFTTGLSETAGHTERIFYCRVI